MSDLVLELSDGGDKHHLVDVYALWFESGISPTQVHSLNVQTLNLLCYFQNRGGPRTVVFYIKPTPVVIVSISSTQSLLSSVPVNLPMCSFL